MLVLNPNRDCMEDLTPLPLADRKVIDVVIAEDWLLHVYPADHFRVYMLTSHHPQEYIDYYRALGHQVNILNGQVTVCKWSGSWRVEKLPPWQDTQADLTVFRESSSSNSQIGEHDIVGDYDTPETFYQEKGEGIAQLSPSRPQGWGSDLTERQKV